MALSKVDPRRPGARADAAEGDGCAGDPQAARRRRRLLRLRHRVPADPRPAARLVRRHRALRQARPRRRAADRRPVRRRPELRPVRRRLPPEVRGPPRAGAQAARPAARQLRHRRRQDVERAVLRRHPELGAGRVQDERRRRLRRRRHRGVARLRRPAVSVAALLLPRRSRVQGQGQGVRRDARLGRRHGHAGGPGPLADQGRVQLLDPVVGQDRAVRGELGRGRGGRHRHRVARARRSRRAGEPGQPHARRPGRAAPARSRWRRPRAPTSSPTRSAVSPSARAPCRST